MIRLLLISLITSLVVTSTFASESLIFEVPTQPDILSTYSGKVCNSCKLAKRIQVSVWNMYKGKNTDWYYDYNKLIDTSDLVLGQEFLLSGVMKNALTTPPLTQNIMATSFYNKKGQATGVFTSSRVKATDAVAVQSPTREPITNTPKMGLIAQYPTTNGQVLTIVNIHSLNFVGTSSFFGQISDLLKRVQSIKGPVIFAGDFNTNTPAKTMTMHIHFKRAGFKEVKFNGSDDRLTFLGQKLDHIWYRGLNLIQARVLGHYEGSDHKPMQAEFELID